MNLLLSRACKLSKKEIQIAKLYLSSPDILIHVNFSKIFSIPPMLRFPIPVKIGILLEQSGVWRKLSDQSIILGSNRIGMQNTFLGSNRIGVIFSYQVNYNIVYKEVFFNIFF